MMTKRMTISIINVNSGYENYDDEVYRPYYNCDETTIMITIMNTTLTMMSILTMVRTPVLLNRKYVWSKMKMNRRMNVQPNRY